MIRTQQMPVVPEFDGDVQRWADDLSSFLSEMIRDIYHDVSEGASTHRVLAAVPGVSNIAEGEFVVVDTGASRSIAVKVNGTVRVVSLT